MYTRRDVFQAIADPQRRAIIDLVARQQLTLNGVAEQFDISRPAISQHLRVLLDAGLVAERRHGRERLYRLVPERLAPVRNWLALYEDFWDDRLGRLQHHLSKKAKP